MKKILVTGGAGYIGSHTAVELLLAGKEIVIVDNFCNSKPEAIDNIKKITGKDFAFYEADLRNRTAIEKIFCENEIDCVIHFAGLKAVGESVAMPLEYYHNNLVSTLILCQVMAEKNVKKLVFSSSATVYGDPHTVPIVEDFPLHTTNPYGTTKLMIEQILKDIYVSDSEWGIVILRYFNPIGANKSGIIGEDPNGIPNNLLPYVAKVAAGELPHLNVFGDDYPTVDGTGVRDYIHVVDLSLGHVCAVDKIKLESGVFTYNLGTGNGYSVLQLVKAFEKASGRPVPYKIVERRPGDIAACYANPEKAKAELGWSAQYGIDEMCSDAWRFVAKKKGL
ncbi:MAG: UDP-glucose 4-epimerase GalE [Clostridia bacterium]|nr:UDP-glucose 4-epimerase GalE [Oscillospiraceae bacterium]MBQ7032146.1 UDP-glucose 4-epimerase GalE [Clostridia bacterium]